MPWKGVTCSFGEVVELELGEAGLQGSLPTEVGLLTSLKGTTSYIYGERFLGFNTLTGHLPTQIGRWSAIETL